MKTKSYLLLALLVAVSTVVGALILHKDTSKTGENQPSAPQIVGATIAEVETTTKNDDDLDPDRSKGIAMIEKQIGKLSEAEIELKPKSMSWLKWGYAVTSHRVATAKNGSIVFYGKVVSEDGTPLSGVNMKARILYAEPSLAKMVESGDSSRQREFHVESDQHGEFIVENVEGGRLIISQIRKEFYILEGRKNHWSGSFVPNSSKRHIPDPENPVIFTMKKIGG